MKRERGRERTGKQGWREGWICKEREGERMDGERGMDG